MRPVHKSKHGGRMAAQLVVVCLRLKSHEIVCW